MTTGLRHLLPALREMNTSARPLSLRDLGRLIHLSPGRAQRVFTWFVGESPHRYQWRVRLDRAAQLLTATDEPITDIAFRVGFGSHEAFTRAFHRRHGATPRQYRTRNSVPMSGQDGETGRSASSGAVSPCIGLYRRPLSVPGRTTAPAAESSHRTEELIVDYEITTKELEPVPMLFMARRVDKERFAEVLAECLPAVFQYVMEQGLAMAGPPFVRYLSQSAAFWEIEAGIPLLEQPKPPEAETGITAGELPGGKTAVTVHKGPYDTLGEGHMALDRWMADRGVGSAGPAWEVYLTDPGEVPDPAEWLTEILWPIT